MDWVAVGLSADLPPGQVAPTRVESRDLAIWCSVSGQYHAWGDRCPHRGMRLSHGFVRGETLSCIYHGWRYDQDGRCDFIPAHPKLEAPKTICATAYKCTERDGIIWVSLTGSAGEPPTIDGLRTVRSLPVDLSAEALASRLGLDLAPIVHTGGEPNLAAGLQPVDETRCILHALADADRDPREISNAFEDLRAHVEGPVQ